MVKEAYGARAAMSVTSHLGRPKERHVNVLVDATAGINFGVHNNNLDNTTRAILERVFFVSICGKFQPPPKPNSNTLVEGRLSEFYKQFQRHSFIATTWSRSQFCEAYTGLKKNMYVRAAEGLLVKPLTISDSYVTSFVKAEKVNLSAKPDPAPRIIQPRTPRYNVEVGCYIKPIEPLIYKAIAEVYGSPTVVKGYNSVTVGGIINKKWNRFNRPVAIGLDASRFDQHCSIPILQWEHKVYRSFFRGDRWFAKLLRMQLRNHGYANCADGRIKYRTDGCRMSGDMNTGLGNCLIMCALVYSYFGVFREYELLNNGDDCVVILEASDLWRLDNLPTWFLEMGFTMKVEKPVYTIQEIEFCQAKPIYDGSNWRMTRDPRVCLTKDLISLQNLSSKNSWRRQCQAISDCGKALAGDLPIFCAFYKMLDTGYNIKKKNTQPTNGLEYMGKGLNYEFTRPTDISRFNFFLAFGITPDKQIALEDTYRGLTIEYNPGPVIRFTDITEKELL
jgi:hypothetical protein